MQQYVALLRLTPKGLQELGNSAARRKTSEDRVGSLGGRSIAFFITLGAYDFVQVFEMPSNAAMMQYALSARRDGFVEPLILPAFDIAKFNDILDNLSSREVTEGEPTHV